MNRNTMNPRQDVPHHTIGRGEVDGQNAQTGVYENPRAAARYAAELLYQEQRRRLHAAGKRERQ